MNRRCQKRGRWPNIPLRPPSAPKSSLSPPSPLPNSLPSLLSLGTARREESAHKVAQSSGCRAEWLAVRSTSARGPAATGPRRPPSVPEAGRGAPHCPAPIPALRATGIRSPPLPWRSQCCSHPLSPGEGALWPPETAQEPVLPAGRALGEPDSGVCLHEEPISLGGIPHPLANVIARSGE